MRIWRFAVNIFWLNTWTNCNSYFRPFSTITKIICYSRPFCTSFSVFWNKNVHTKWKKTCINEHTKTTKTVRNRTEGALAVTKNTIGAHGRKINSDSRGSYRMTHKAVTPCLTVCFMGARQPGCLLTAVPLHFYSCHWGTAAGASAALIFHIYQGNYQTKPSKEDHWESWILT